jgi:hypothetical protein
VLQGIPGKSQAIHTYQCLLEMEMSGRNGSDTGFERNTRELSDWRYAYFTTLYRVPKVFRGTELICIEKTADKTVET